MFISEALAISAATCIAISGMLINELSGKVHVLRLARWQMIAALVMTGTVSVILGGWRTVALWQLGFLAASSFFGIIIASTTYFAAIYAIGARNTALLFSLTSPFAFLFGYIALGETVSPQQTLGVLLVLAGIVLAVGFGRRTAVATETPASSTPQKPRDRAFTIGIGLGVVTALGQALGSLCARPAMAAGVEPFTAMAIRSGIAALFFILLAAFPIIPTQQNGETEWKMRVLAVSAAFFGTGLGMSLLMAALAHGNVGIVSTLSSMTPVVILPMVWARTGKAPPPLAWACACLAVAGTALISL